MLKKILKIGREKNMLSLTTSLVSAIFGLAGFMLLTRSLDIDIFGDWVLFVTLASFLDMLRFGLTSTALVRFASTDNISERESYLGASYKIGLYAVGVISFLLWSGFLIMSSSDINITGGYRLFAIWYPLLSLLNLSWNNSISYLQAHQDFKRILYIRLFSVLPFFLFLLLNFIWLKLGIKEILYAFLISNLLPSIFVFVKHWDGLSHIKKATKESIDKMLNFGKFSMGTLIGSSLLRSADTIIIGMSPILGSVGVALYAIPLKLIDLLAIPLRSFSITAYPKMSKKSIDGDIEGFKKIFYTYSGAITLLFIPLAIFCYFFAEQLIIILGGSGYSDNMTTLINVFRIFVVYSILLPADRFTGVALDSINRPKFNFYKVLVMASANVIGDLIAVFWIGSLESVAIVTVLFTIIGIILGYIYLNKFVPVKVSNIFYEGVNFFKNIRQYI
ncbi:MAG: hypothetical protein Q8R90_01440 [Bacteroidales bacterium]|nr:hypothetical protein [Bacteroidales bacterium]